MDVTQWINIILALGLLTISIIRILQTPQKAFLRIPVILLGLHVLLFYTYVYLNLSGYFQEGTYFERLKSGDWSAILRLHSLMTYILLEVYGYWKEKIWKEL